MCSSHEGKFNTNISNKKHSLNKIMLKHIFLFENSRSAVVFIIFVHLSVILIRTKEL